MIKEHFFAGFVVLSLTLFFIRVIANEPTSYQILKDRKSQADITTTIRVISLIQCAIQCTKRPECKSAQFKDGICEMMYERYACLDPDTQPGWQYFFFDLNDDSVNETAHDLENVALHCPAEASSAHPSYQGFARHAVDGIMETDFRVYPCTHTYMETDPWWAVDLEIPRKVYSVQVTNMGYCCPARLHDFVTYVSSDVISPRGSQDREVCKYFSGTMARGVTRELTCYQPVVGRFFSLMIPGADNYVTICEAAVMGI